MLVELIAISKKDKQSWDCKLLEPHLCSNPKDRASYVSLDVQVGQDLEGVDLKPGMVLNIDYYHTYIGIAEGCSVVEGQDND